MRYLKLWECILDSEKIQKLNERAFKSWIFFLVCAKKLDANGDLPEVKTLAFWCRKKEKTIEQWLGLVADAGLIEWTGSCWHIHDWEYWQAPHDPTAVTRMQRYRARRNAGVTVRNDERNVTDNVALPVTPLRRDCERRMVKGKTTPLPPLGEKNVSSSDEISAPEYPDPLTSMHIIMTGEHRMETLEAREIWGAIWRAWGNPKLCYEFYEHQQWCTAGGWRYAIKTAITQGVKPGSIRYLEVIALDADANGEKQPAKPIKRGDLGSVPYKSSPAPPCQSPKIHDPGPPIPADEAYRIMTGRSRGGMPS